jgi:glycosyl transferase family 25
MSDQVKVFVISLSDAVQRRESACAQLNGARVSWEFVDAVRSDSETVVEMLKTCRDSRKWHKPLLAGEIACYLSHRKVWQKMIDEQIESALILEDDFLLKMPMDEIIELLQRFQSDYDMIKIFGNPKHSRSVEECLINQRIYQLHQAFSVTGITVAQWVRANALPRLLAKSERIERPIDMDLKHHWEYPLKILHLLPPVVDEVSSQLGGSSIGARKPKKTVRQWLKRWAAKCVYYGNCIQHYHR